MFDTAINLILRELNAVIVPTQDEGSAAVVSGNISLNEDQQHSQALREHVVITVVNIAEEAALKNAAYFERAGERVLYRNAPAFLNLYLLFCANYNDYNNALKRLSQVVSFFQGKNTFTLKDSPSSYSIEGVEDMRLILELFALTFEQVNYLWASLGGRQMPFVLYKLRLVRIAADRIQSEKPVIEEVSAKEQAV